MGHNSFTWVDASERFPGEHSISICGFASNNPKLIASARLIVSLDKSDRRAKLDGQTLEDLSKVNIIGKETA
jgi:hypothetical protein